MKTTRAKPILRAVSRSVAPLQMAWALAVLGLGGNFALSLYHVNRLAENDRTLSRDYDLLDKIQSLNLVMHELETGHRGYLLTGDADYLRPYRDASLRVARLRRDLEETLRAQRIGIDRLPKLGAAIDLKQAHTREAIDTRQNQGYEAAKQLVQTGQGKQAMDAIRGVLSEIETLARMDLAAVIRQSQFSYWTALGTIVFGAGLALFMTVVALRLIHIELQEKKRAQELLLRAHGELEDRIRERTLHLQLANQNLQVENLERQRMEEKARQIADELERSNRELEQFAYIASHDLQEPLRKIQAFGDRLNSFCRDALSDQGREYLERILRSAGRMRSLINDLLTFSRVSTRPQIFERVDLNAVAVEVVSDLESLAQQCGGTVELGPLGEIEADAVQMRQLLQNLIGNALKFHRPGVPPRVSVAGRWVQTTPEDANGRLELEVVDNGTGFEERYLDRIFQVFQRLHPRDQYEGTGMGLAICRKIVERHGGQITARSRLGEGSTFLVRLPGQPGTEPSEIPCLATANRSPS